MTKSIFISSTALDLAEHRSAVKKAIERLELRAIDMNNFGAQDGDAIKVSLEQVGKADIFIGIIAYRYGYVPEGMTKSVTERENDEAKRRRIPRLMYLVDKKYKWPGEIIDEGETARSKLEAFRTRMEKERVRALFTTPDNLAAQVVSDLARELNRQRNLRWLLSVIAVVFALVGVIGYVYFFRPDILIAQGLLPPTPMKSGFNVVVAGLGLQNADGQIVSSTEADSITSDIAGSLGEFVTNDHLRSFPDPGVPHILDATAQDRESDAAKLAETHGADVVIYGLIQQDLGSFVFQPQIYISPKAATNREQELIGVENFGEPLVLLPGSDITPALEGRIETLRLFLQGLSLYLTGYYDQALLIFQNVIDTHYEPGLESPLYSRGKFGGTRSGLRNSAGLLYSIPDGPSRLRTRLTRTWFCVISACRSI